MLHTHKCGCLSVLASLQERPISVTHRLPADAIMKCSLQILGTSAIIIKHTPETRVVLPRALAYGIMRAEATYRQHADLGSNDDEVT